MESKVEDFLKKRERENLLRVLAPCESRKDGFIYFGGEKYTDFGSNDYLGISRHPALKNAAKLARDKFGSGASASRLLSGDLGICHELEEKTASFKGKESALVFNSGYQANVGIISALLRPGDVIFSDKLNHASIVDGILLSKARFFRFSHNDAGHLESLLRKERHKFKTSLIITETVFSMDGEMPPLKELVSLKEKYASSLMVDEAHATGIFGEKGSGMVEEEGLTDRVDLIMGTFGKVLGSFGAYLASSGKMKEYLINTCRSFIYSTGLPPSVIAANIAAIGLVRKEPYRRTRLLENAKHFRGSLKKLGLEIKGSSQIVPVIIGESSKTAGLSRELRLRRHWALPIRPPTVPEGTARLRLSLTYHHTKEILQKFIDDIREISNI